MTDLPTDLPPPGLSLGDPASRLDLWHSEQRTAKRLADLSAQIDTIDDKMAGHALKIALILLFLAALGAALWWAGSVLLRTLLGPLVKTLLGLG